MKPFVLKYIPELISRYVKIVSNNNEPIADKEFETKEEKLENIGKENTKEQFKKTNTKNKRQKPQVDIEEIEEMILMKIFNVDKEVI